MQGIGTWAGVITALFAAITALGGMVVSIKVLIPNFRQTKEVHKIVNQERTDRMRYQKVLEAVLKAHDIDLPEDQSKVLD